MADKTVTAPAGTESRTDAIHNTPQDLSARMWPLLDNV